MNESKREVNVNVNVTPLYNFHLVVEYSLISCTKRSFWSLHHYTTYTIRELKVRKNRRTKTTEDIQKPCIQKKREPR